MEEQAPEVPTEVAETPVESLPEVEETAAAAPDAPPKPNRSRLQRREQAAADALRGLIRDLIAEKAPETPLTEVLPLTLQVELLPGSPGELRFTPSLRRQVNDQLPDTCYGSPHYLEGFVFNHQTGTAEGEGCRPLEADQIFAGYDNMGRPVWQSYTQWLLDRKDEAVDQLHQRRGGAVTRIQRGKDLKAEQSAVFGKASRDYALLGQLTSGYYDLPKGYDRVAGVDRVAVTVQIAETRDTRGRLQLRLNVIAGGLLPDEWQTLLQEHGFRNLREGLEAARAALAEVERSARQASMAKQPEGLQQAMRRVPRVLQQLQDHLEGRKPAKTSDRPQDGRWKEDLAEITEGEVFHDASRDSWVFLGPRGLAHVFHESGRWITTFPVTADLIEKRIVSERWQMDPAGAAAVYARVCAAAKS